MKMSTTSALKAAIALALFVSPPSFAHVNRDWSIELERVGTYASGKFAVGAAEIVTYDALTRRVFVVNAADTTVDVLDVSNPASPQKIGAIDASALGGSANSIDT